MKRMISIIVLFILVLFTFTSCTKLVKPVSAYVDSKMIKENEHVEKINEYDSPYTMCYKNKDNTYTAYIFSSPISFINEEGEYEYINNDIVKVNDQNLINEGYFYENARNSIHTYFPSDDNEDYLIRKNNNILQYSLVKDDDNTCFSSELRKSLNMYGDYKQAIIYKNNSNNISIKNYVTNAGINSEIVLNRYPGTNEISFKVIAPDCYPTNTHNGYITFRNKDSLEWVIYYGIQKDSFQDSYTENDHHLSTKSDAEVTTIDDNPNEYMITFKLDNNFLTNTNTIYPITFDTFFNSYLNKQPDSGIYSNINSTNSYLSAISVIGNSETLGIGRQFIRFRFDYFFDCDPSTIISSGYYLRELTNFSSDEKISLYKLNEQWSSTNLTWNMASKIDYNNCISSISINYGGIVGFDITDFTRDCFNDKDSMETEIYGLLLKGNEESNRFRIFSTSDNSLYIPFIKINLSKLPANFYFSDNINK